MRRDLRESIESRARELMREEGLQWVDAKAQSDEEHRCKAKARSRGGAPCRAYKVPGKRGCRMHFGNVNEAVRLERSFEARVRKLAMAST